MIFIIHTEKLKSINVFYGCNHIMVSFIEFHDYCHSNPNSDYVRIFDNNIKVLPECTYMLFDTVKVTVNNNVTEEFLKHAWNISEASQSESQFNELIHIVNECINKHNVDKIAVITDKFEPYMDDKNKEAYNVMKTQGIDSAIEHMFTRSDGSKRSYSEMRSLYG